MAKNPSSVERKKKADEAAVLENLTETDREPMGMTDQGPMEATNQELMVEISLGHTEETNLEHTEAIDQEHHPTALRKALTISLGQVAIATKNHDLRAVELDQNDNIEQIISLQKRSLNGFFFV